MGNGFGNRFIWACVRRSKLLPDGGDLFSVDWTPIQDELSAAMLFANGSSSLCMTPRPGGA